MAKNCMVAQSGGPTAAINASLAGVVRQALDLDFDHIYGAVHGIKGVIDDKFLDLKAQASEPADYDFVERLIRTPAMYLGSCRYKLPSDSDDPEVYDLIFKRFAEMEVEAFFYIGGNDSMDTVDKLSAHAAKIGSNVRIVGIPKTIDNDLVHTDHTPGFGSAAKYIATTLLEISHDAHIYPVKSVTIVEIMGRDAGWLTGASVLARTEYSTAPDLIYLPEVEFDVAACISATETLLETQDSVIIAISEGIHDKHGNYISSTETVADTFGHSQLSGAGKSLEYQIKDALGIKVRSVEVNISQRCGSHIASETDLIESFALGKEAVKQAVGGATGIMIAMERSSGSAYEVTYTTVPVKEVANQVKHVPVAWINSRGDDVKSEFVDYVRPLIEGEISQTYVNGVPAYLPIPHLMGVDSEG